MFRSEDDCARVGIESKKCNTSLALSSLALYLSLIAPAQSAVADDLGRNVDLHIPAAATLDLEPSERRNKSDAPSMSATESMEYKYKGTPVDLGGRSQARSSLVSLHRDNQVLFAATNAPLESNSASEEQSGKKSNNTGREAPELEVVVVTAQKRSENLMEVPAAISAIGGARLESQQVNSLSDLANYVPGLSMQDGGALGKRTVVIRGLSTGYSPITSSPLTATYIDDTPVGATTGARAAQFGLDVMPYDLERIEVLRGPQGTLYGAGAMGGIIKYVMRKPDLTAFESRVGGSSDYVDGSGGAVWGGRGAINIPLLTDKLGLRVSGMYQDRPGYIDNIGTGDRNSNALTQSAVRTAMLWSATEKLSLQASFMYQDIDQEDNTAVTIDAATHKPFYGDDIRSTNFAESFAQKTLFAALAIEWDLGPLKLTSSSSWSELKSNVVTELPGFGQYTPGVPDALARSIITDEVSKFVEEVRLTSSDTQRIEWMLGGLYTREEPTERYSLPSSTAAGEPLPFDLFNYYNPESVFEEQAVFGNATYKLTRRFDVSGGLRYAENKSHACTYHDGLLNPREVLNPDGPLCTSRPAEGNTTWMVNTRFHPNEDTMVYARIATGYRPGGGCTGCGSAVFETPDFFDSDEITNYEMGLKGQLYEHRLNLEVSVFYIDWNNIQISLISPRGSGYTGNGGKATSSGVELATGYQATGNLRIDATLAFTDAQLAEDAPTIGGRDGDQLPVSPRWTSSLTADYNRPVGENTALLLGASYRYRDKIYNQLPSSPNPVPLGPQNIVDISGGLVKGRTTMRLYGRNVFDNRSYTGLLDLFTPQRPMVVPVQPRTVGISVDYRF